MATGRTPRSRLRSLALVMAAMLVMLVATWLPYLVRSNVFELPILNNLDPILQTSGFGDTITDRRGTVRPIQEDATVTIPETLSPHYAIMTFYVDNDVVTIGYPNALPSIPGLETNKIISRHFTLEGFFEIAPDKVIVKSLRGQSAIFNMKMQTLRIPPLGMLLVGIIMVGSLVWLGLRLGYSAVRALIMGLLPGGLLVFYWQYDRLTAGGLMVALVCTGVAWATMLLLHQNKLFGFPPHPNPLPRGEREQSNLTSPVNELLPRGEREQSSLTPPVNELLSRGARGQILLTKSKAGGATSLLRFIPPLVLVVWVGLQYSRVFGYGLFYDDYHIVRSWSVGEVFGTFAGTWDTLRLEPIYFRPITVVTFGLDWLIWQYNPFGYHLTNLMLHTLVVLLAYALMQRLRLGWFASLVGAAWFSVLPYNAATATWISQRSDALALLGILAGLWLYITAWYSLGNRKGLPLLVGALGCFAFAVGAKEIAVIFPALCLLYAVVVGFKLPEKVSRSRLIILIVAPWVLAGLYLVYRTLVLPNTPTVSGKSSLDLLWRGFAQVVTETFYPLSEWFGDGAANWFTLSLLLGFGWYLVAKFGLKYHFSTGWEAFFYGLAWVLAACAPLSLLALSYGATSRVLYVPALGYALMIAGLCRLLVNFLNNGLWLPRFWVGLVMALGLLIAIALPMRDANIFIQRQYAPNDSNTLNFDLRVYQEWRGKIPERHIQFIEEKLKAAGKL